MILGTSLVGDLDSNVQGLETGLVLSDCQSRVAFQQGAVSGVVVLIRLLARNGSIYAGGLAGRHARLGDSGLWRGGAARKGADHDDEPDKCFQRQLKLESEEEAESLEA